MIETHEVKITQESIQTELKGYENKPYDCLFEYVWNSFDAGADTVEINYKIPEGGVGFISDVEIIDNGKGWEFSTDKNTGTFLSSTKSKESKKEKTLPMGKFGRGRYSFIWLADGIDVYSNKKKISLTHEIKFSLEDNKYDTKGTKICFVGINEVLSSALNAQENLIQEIIINFGWFIKQNPNYKIIVNGCLVDPLSNIKLSKKLNIENFSENVVKYLKNQSLDIEIVLWKKKPSEWSSFYFLDKSHKELFKKSTSLNKKNDDFWHSVYILSDFFIDNKEIDDIDKLDIPTLDSNPEQDNRRKAKKKLIEELKEEIVKLRKPYLVEQSEHLIISLKQDKILPNLSEYGIFDESSYNDLLKTVYVISPSLFVNKNDADKKFICATFAGLLSIQDKNLIQKIIEQLQELTEEEKDDLNKILSKTSLSNILKTIKEIDHRLEVIDGLKLLISEYEKETLEVKHLQKILDENFWIFGEQFRLFSSTEGSLKNVITKYAQEILKIEMPELDSQPTGELDLFLVKTEESNGIQKNIIIELKRASINLKENDEYLQIKTYCNKILEQNLCNGVNQYWEFYLIGKSYDSGIEGLINSAQNHGEKTRGLTFWDKEGRVKIYVRKWSDILEAEWGTKMKYLKDKLKLSLSQDTSTSTVNIVETLIK